MMTETHGSRRAEDKGSKVACFSALLSICGSVAHGTSSGGVVRVVAEAARIGRRRSGTGGGGAVAARVVARGIAVAVVAAVRHVRCVHANLRGGVPRRREAGAAAGVRHVRRVPRAAVSAGEEGR